MKKLMIIIPCLNEEKTLPQTLADIPKTIEGISEIEILIINDGSTDNTVGVAKKHGVQHIVSFSSNKGLVQAMMAGYEYALRWQADIILQTDGDNQYKGEDIPNLIQPILQKKAEIVIGDRPIGSIEDFSFIKKKLQMLGSAVVRKLSKTNVQDSTSGFRSYTRDALMRISIFSTFSYTLEIIIQAGRKNISIVSVPIRTNRKTRESRLFKSIFQYIRKQLVTMIRIFAIYEPMLFFSIVSSFFMGIGTFLALRYLYIVNFVLTGVEAGRGAYIVSGVLSMFCIFLGIIIFMIGFLSDIIAANRKLNEDILYRLKRLEGNEKGPFSSSDIKI